MIVRVEGHDKFVFASVRVRVRVIPFVKNKSQAKNKFHFWIRPGNADNAGSVVDSILTVRHGRMAEWSKALVLGTSHFGGAGSNPVPVIIGLPQRSLTS